MTLADDGVVDSERSALVAHGAERAATAPPGEAAARAIEVVEAWERAVGACTDARRVATLSGGLVNALTVMAGRLDRMTLAQREQFRVLTWIRQTCDAAAGVQRERRDKRMPGAKGAVRVLVQRYAAQGARLAAVSAELEALRVEHDRLSVALAEREGWQAGLPEIAPAARE